MLERGFALIGSLVVGVTALIALRNDWKKSGLRLRAGVLRRDRRAGTEGVSDVRRT
jgi:hypothetical protein